jgi:hypothetical protein
MGVEVQDQQAVDQAAVDGDELVEGTTLVAVAAPLA